MVVLPAGSFTNGLDANKPMVMNGMVMNTSIQVTIDKPFAIGQYPVNECTNIGKFKPAHDSGDYKGHSLNSDDQPVV